MTPAVQIDGARVVVGARVLLDLPRFVVDTGEHVAIVGPNGAGKSTLLKLIGGLATAQQGQVQVLGLAVGPAAGLPGRSGKAQRLALRRDTGLLMQGLHLVPRLTARENVLIGALARLRGVDAWRSLLRWYPPALQGEADAALVALGLAERAGTRADRLSGGERQKVALARVQLQRPRLLLADEPTSALDPAATTQVCEALRALASENGCTMLSVVHDLDLLPQLATRVIGMAAGRVQWDRPIDAVTKPMLHKLYEAHAGETSVVQERAHPAIAGLARA